MERSGSLFPGVVTACLLSGPCFVITCAAAIAYLELPKAVPVNLNAILIVALVMLPATLWGAAISLIPNIVGANLMAGLADRFAFARSSFVWAIVGAAVGLGVFRFFASGYDLEPLGFALVVTSAVCAAVCKVGLSWS